MQTRRIFLRTAGAAAIVPLLAPRVLDSLERRLEGFATVPASDAIAQGEFWAEIRRVFPVPPDYINLENGYSSPQPGPTFAAFQGHEKTVNDGLSFYMRRKMMADRMTVKNALAELAGVRPEEIVITRNTTESLGTVIHGLTYAPGDEAVMCDQDYGSMLQQFRQESRRHGVKCVEIVLPLVPRDDEDILAAYERAITPRTKVLLVSHMVNITGQILPVKKIAAMAHARGVGVIVDAAHSFAHLRYAVPELDGDYFGASLHKWLCTPLGAGILYVKKDKIPSIWPLLGETAVGDDDIRKLERLGTQPEWTRLAILDAIRFHNMIGAERKEARLRFLQQYWTDKVREIPKVYLNTPSGTRACAIANVGIAGMTPKAVADALFEQHRIYTVAIDTKAVKGTRVTPHLYTTTAELDALVRALREIASTA